MFKIENGTITISKGDTGSIVFEVHVDQEGPQPLTITPDDKAIFTVKSMEGTIIKEGYYSFDSGSFTVSFNNSDTDMLSVGSYQWDVRYVINPRYTAGRIVDGDQVITPETPATLQLINVVGEV